MHSKPDFTRKNVTAWMRRNADDYREWLTEEVHLSALVEAAAEHFDQNKLGGPLDDETLWIWDAAIDATEKAAG